MKNIIFFLDSEKKPSGGRKVIYQVSNFINTQNNFKSSILHVKKKKFSKFILSIKKKFKINNTTTGWSLKELKINKKINLNWYKHKISIKKNLIFDPKNDHVILPEIFAHFAKDLLVDKNIQFSIFVQNGYALFSTNDRQRLKIAYKKAKFILSVSNHIDDCVIKAFPQCRNKILRIIPGIESKKLISNIKKKNLITYMPRKLLRHSELVLSYLKPFLPKKWKVVALSNLSEEKVFKLLKSSKIFLSFSELEGLGLPPLEAAISGNLVIGYTGEAGKEYWKEPIFKEVKNGEILKFVETIIENLENKFLFKTNKNIIQKIIKKFSFKNQEMTIKKFLKKLN